MTTKFTTRMTTIAAATIATLASPAAIAIAAHAIATAATIHLAKIARFAPGLQRLDISGNSIGHEGFEALAKAVRETKQLRFLDVSHNSATSIVMPRRRGEFKESCGPLPGKAGENDLPNYNPIAILCEALADNISLKEVHLSNSSVDYSVSTCLLTATALNKTLEVLNLSSNPQGVNGITSVLWCTLNPSSSLVFVDITDIRPGILGPGLEEWGSVIITEVWPGGPGRPGAGGMGVSNYYRGLVRGVLGALGWRNGGQ